LEKDFEEDWELGSLPLLICSQAWHKAQKGTKKQA
jgi:hypothetical protein